MSIAECASEETSVELEEWLSGARQMDEREVHHAPVFDCSKPVCTSNTSIFDSFVQMSRCLCTTFLEMCSTSSRGLLLNSLRISSMKDLSIALSSLKSDAIMKKAKRTPMSSLSPMKVSNATSQVYYHGCVSFSIFWDAPSLLYKKSCPSVGPSVRPVLFSKVKSRHLVPCIRPCSTNKTKHRNLSIYVGHSAR